MKSKVLQLAYALVLMTVCAKSHAGINKHNLTEITKKYLTAKTAVQQKNSTKADIEHMLSFMKDDIQTEHKPHKTLQCENDGKGKEGFREGLSYYLGKYTSTKLTIDSVTEGKNMVAVKFTEVIKYMRDGKMITDKSANFFVLEFTDNLISREFRYDL